MKKTMTDINKEKEVETQDQSYGFYSRILKKVFDSLEDLKKAEDEYALELKAKEDKATAKKADAKKVEDTFKALNAARREYKTKIEEITKVYNEGIISLKTKYEDSCKLIKEELANAENAYASALKEFTDKYETYHISLKDGDFETTISSQTSTVNTPEAKQLSMFELFDYLFKKF
jgi:DNA repair ATPase RecN